MGNRNTTFRIIRVFMRITRSLINFTKRGIPHPFQLIYICLVLPFKMKILPSYLELYLRIQERFEKYYYADKEIKYWQQKKKDLLKVKKSGYKIKIEELGLNHDKLKLLKKLQQQLRVIIIAEIDNDGFLLSHFGAIRNAQTISKKQFVVRKRFDLKLVAIDGYVGVKKDYKGNKLSFVNELNALHKLGLRGCNVPVIMDVDFDNLTLIFSYILGSLLREELVKKGAILHDRDFDNNPDLKSLNQNERMLKRIQEAKRVLYDVVNLQFIDSVFTDLNKIHISGYILDDINYGNIIIEKESGNHYLIDFEMARYYPNLGKESFRILCDRDVEKFNLFFGTEKLTYKKMREEIRKIIKGINVYSPVYFGAGLKMGRIWDVDVGYARWHYILKNNLPSLSGKRILDLGANNAFNSLQMLRNGAREVIGIELNKKFITQGNFIKEGFEWMDNTRYNFRYIQANMKNIPTMNLGKFDMVLALCSIYYLDDNSIANLTQFISKITDIFILQCNITTYRIDPHDYKKASIEYTLNILKNNGFPIAQVIAPSRYSRPLVIGKKR